MRKILNSHLKKLRDVFKDRIHQYVLEENTQGLYVRFETEVQNHFEISDHRSASRVSIGFLTIPFAKATVTVCKKRHTGPKDKTSGFWWQCLYFLHLFFSFWNGGINTCLPISQGFVKTNCDNNCKRFWQNRMNSKF